MLPPPEEMLMMRGVPVDLESSGSKASVTSRGPVALVANACAYFEAGEPSCQPRAALLTKASSLEKSAREEDWMQIHG